MKTALRQPLTVHGVPCLLTGTSGLYRIARADTGAELARGPSRLLVVAKAAVTLHTPARAAVQGA